jgi:hypothetical protein
MSMRLSLLAAAVLSLAAVPDLTAAPIVRAVGGDDTAAPIQG